MRTASLASSSAGNCYALVFDLGEGRKASLLVECGVPYQAITRKLAENGLSIADFRHCLITHSHADHSIAARDLAKRGVGIFATDGCLKALGVPGTPMEYLKPTKVEDGLFVMPFRVKHDAPEPAGFVIKTKAETVVFGIDSQRWLDDLSNFRPNYVFCEANYDGAIMGAEQLSLRRMAAKDAERRYIQNCRVVAQHMSIEGAERTLLRLKLEACEAIFLTHLSDRMASAPAFKRAVEGKTGVATFVCLKNGGIE